jgi:hypothetical protein
MLLEVRRERCFPLQPGSQTRSLEVRYSERTVVVDANKTHRSATGAAS